MDPPGQTMESMLSEFDWLGGLSNPEDMDITRDLEQELAREQPHSPIQDLADSHDDMDITLMESFTFPGLPSSSAPFNPDTLVGGTGGWY